ncbi:hypothetical protein MN116_008398 [Schistosoma mekongi]|uniref:RB1-inducible coiled-coil protein 1 n=1 Tax=Schistosoma mekongi TaxID=38744 RepID=A0AAE1Z6L7_SCHME|nr:hypothetical protein MN116_008398 [Schistosoma mekongi]
MYIFLMDQGRLVSLDDNLLSQTVSSLRNVLAHDFDLPLNKQILLVSGGFQLEPGDKLSTYGAGLDKTNPIYVFTQTSSNDTNAQKPDVLQVNDGGYPRQLASLLELAPSEKIFEERLRLIRSLTPIGREAANAIEQLVSEQRQMIQGWCVALANLAEVAADTNKRLLFATSRLVQFEGCVSDWERKLYNFDDLKRELSELPLPPQLVAGTNETIDQKESFAYNSVSKPTNLYEWVCLQSAISSIGTRYSLPPSTIKAVGLQTVALYLGRHSDHSTGRIRTTSTGHIGGGSCGGGGDGNISTNSGSSFVTAPSQPAKISFYTGGSQTSLNSLGTGCSDSPLSTMDYQFSTKDSGSSSCTHVHDSSTSSDNYYESAFLDIIKRALRDIHSLRCGPESSFCMGSKPPEAFNNELPYVRAQTSRLSELITMVNACSKSNYDEMTISSSMIGVNTIPLSKDTPTASIKKDVSVTDNETLEKTQMSSFTSSSSPSTLFSVNLPQVVDDIHLISVRDALDPGYFSQRLSQLDPLMCEAVDLARKMIGIEQYATKSYQQIVQQKINSVLQTKFLENTQNSQKLIIAFNRLCEILGIVMESKLLLANNLSDRQRWLQNFQSELNRLDAIIQHCLRRMCRVTTTGTLISQLCEGRSTYARCLAEIVRRTEFDDMLTQRSVCYLKEETNLRTEECRRRRVFSKHLKNNVLHSLFSPWTNPKTECLGLANIPTTISMSQDVDQQSSETSTLTNAPTPSTTTATTTSNRKLDSPSHGPTTASELTVNRRYAVSSLSEPRLNELAKACALNRIQHSRVRTTRLNSLSSPDPQLTKVKEDEMIESSQSKKHTETNVSTQQLQPAQLRQQHTRPMLDANRRASMPFYESDRGDTSGVSNWSIDSSLLGVLSNNFYPTTQPVKITRDDLEKLMQSMPVNVRNLLQAELNKSFSLMKSASYMPNSSLISCGSDHTSSGVCSGPSSIPLMERTNLKATTISGTQIYAPETKSITTSPFCSVENIPSTRNLIDVACQAECSLIEPIINVGSGRSLNSSLGLSVDDSVRRATTPTVNNHIGWDEPPGSLCSWELCRFPVIVRSRDRMSISLDTLPRFEHLITTGTQTEEQQLSEFLESDCIPCSDKPMHTTELDFQKTIKSDENSKSHGIDNDEGYYQHSQSLLTTFNDQQDPSFLPPITNEEIQDDNIIVSSIFAEENMFTDSALMMTSSFHSTKTTFSSNTNNNDVSSSHHTALISINNRSRSMSSSNLCDLTNAGDDGGDCESTTTQYGSMIFDEDIKTSQEVLLLHSSSLPEVQLHNESVERKNQATSFTSLNNNCFKCRLERIRQDYFRLLQESLESINNNDNNSIAEHRQQLQRSDSGTIDSKQPITLIANKQPSISLDALQLKHLFIVLESYSLLFLKSDHICESHPPVEPSLPTTTSELSSSNGLNTSNINTQSDIYSTACMAETTDCLFDPTVKECISNEITHNVDSTSSDQFNFEKSLQYLMDTLQLNTNPVSSCSVSTSTSLLASQLRSTGDSMLTQTETISTVDMATSTTTLPKDPDVEWRLPVCVSDNLTSLTSDEIPLSTISRSTSPILQQQSFNTNEQVSNLLTTSCCSTNISPKSTTTANERFTTFVHSNFLPDDIVIFVPVPGAKQSIPSNNFITAITHTSTTTTTTATTASTTSCILSRDVVKADNSGCDNNSHDSTIVTKSDIWSMNSKLSSNILEVISPSSSLLSSMIVQSSLPFCSSMFMNSSGGGSGTNTATVTTVNNNSCVTIRNSTALANELCTSTLGGNYGTVLPSTTTALLSCESDKNSLATTESCSTIPSTSTVNYIQWRMLSSDGHVYFLHQDDFKTLNIDDHIDYCKPMNSNIQETNSSQHRNISFKEAFPAHNYFIVAKYKSRERCLSKRANNRFNLPKNFIFYRVRARPLNIPQQSPSSHYVSGSIKNSVIHDSCRFLPQSDTDVKKSKNAN